MSVSSFSDAPRREIGIEKGTRLTRLAFDEGVVAQLAGVIGSDRMTAIVRRFADDLVGRFGDLGDREALRRDAHGVASTAGMIGLVSLSDAARDLETVCMSGEDIVERRAVFIDLLRQVDDVIAERFGTAEDRRPTAVPG